MKQQNLEEKQSSMSETKKKAFYSLEMVFAFAEKQLMCKMGYGKGCLEKIVT